MLCHRLGICGAFPLLKKKIIIIINSPDLVQKTLLLSSCCFSKSNLLSWNSAMKVNFVLISLTQELCYCSDLSTICWKQTLTAKTSCNRGPWWSRKTRYANQGDICLGLLFWFISSYITPGNNFYMLHLESRATGSLDNFYIYKCHENMYFQ